MKSFSRRTGVLFVFVSCSIFILLYCPFSNVSGKEEDKTLVFVSPRLPGDPLIKQMCEVYEKILGQLGYAIKYKNLPAKQASIASNSGEVDGELTRVSSYNKQFTNLVRVEEPLHKIEFAAYAVDPGYSFNGWQSLKGYSVDCRRGVVMCTNNVSKVTTMYETNTIDQLVYRLLNGYSDVIVQNAGYFDRYMKSDEFKKIDPQGKIYKAGVMQTITAHTFLHKKHKELVPEISRLLKEMKRTGEYQRIRGWPKGRIE